jgi:hypothetical protein
MSVNKKLVGSEPLLSTTCSTKSPQDLCTAMQANACFVPGGFGLPITHLSSPLVPSWYSSTQSWNLRGEHDRSAKRRRSVGARVRDSWE